MNGCNEALTPVQVVHERFGSRALNPIRSKYDSEQVQLVEHIIALDYKVITHCQCVNWAKLHYRLLGWAWMPWSPCLLTMPLILWGDHLICSDIAGIKCDIP